MNEKPEKKYCVLSLIHDAANRYGVEALHMAKSELKGPGIVQLNDATFIIEFPAAIPALIRAVRLEFCLRKNVRKVQFCMIPCGSTVYGELPEEVAKPLAALGLSYSETPIPDAQS